VATSARVATTSEGRNDALLDRLLQADVGITRSSVPRSRTVVKPANRVALAALWPGGAQGQRLVEHLVIPRCFVVGMEEEMRVAFDEAGEQGFAGQLNLGCIGWGVMAGPAASILSPRTRTVQPSWASGRRRRRLGLVSRGRPRGLLWRPALRPLRKSALCRCGG